MTKKPAESLKQLIYNLMPAAKILNSGLTDTWGRSNRALADKACEGCGELFRPRKSGVRACSRRCGYSIRNLTPYNKGKGKGWVSTKGYVEIKVDGKSVKQHRYIMELALGRKLRPDEDVHHINGIKTDNRAENLQVLLHSEHTILTHTGRRKKVAP